MGAVGGWQQRGYRRVPGAGAITYLLRSGWGERGMKWGGHCGGVSPTPGKSPRELPWGLVHPSPAAWRWEFRGAPGRMGNGQRDQVLLSSVKLMSPCPLFGAFPDLCCQVKPLCIACSNFTLEGRAPFHPSILTPGQGSLCPHPMVVPRSYVTF